MPVFQNAPLVWINAGTPHAATMIRAMDRPGSACSRPQGRGFLQKTQRHRIKVSAGTNHAMGPLARKPAPSESHRHQCQPPQRCAGVSASSSSKARQASATSRIMGMSATHSLPCTRDCRLVSQATPASSPARESCASLRAMPATTSAVR